MTAISTGRQPGRQSLAPAEWQYYDDLRGGSLTTAGGGSGGGGSRSGAADKSIGSATRSAYRNEQLLFHFTSSPYD